MIEVGEYVRTKYGTIHKIVRRDIDKHLLIDNVYLFERYFTFTEEKEDIVKHSKNIIDLIEVGDYVNCYRVEKVSAETNEVLLDHNGFVYRTLKDGDKIVTHEQFESMEYKVGEEI